VFVPAPNVVQVEMVYTMFGQSCENVFHVLCQNGFQTSDLTAIRTLFDNWHLNSYRVNQAASAALRLIVTRHLNTENGVSEEYTLPTPRAGQTTSGGYMPGNVTIVATWTTGLRGRSYRGRTYSVGLAGVHVSGNQLTSAGLTAYQAAYQALLTAINAHANNYRLVVLSRRHNNAWRDQAVATVVTNVGLEANLDSQRRRLTGPGRGI
jgi:hypothetical protein